MTLCVCVFYLTEGNTEDINFGIVLYFLHGGLRLCNPLLPFFDEFQFKLVGLHCPPHTVAAACFFFLRFWMGGFVKLVVVYIPSLAFLCSCTFISKRPMPRAVPWDLGLMRLTTISDGLWEPLAGDMASVKFWSRVPLVDRSCVCLHPST